MHCANLLSQTTPKVHVFIFFICSLIYLPLCVFACMVLVCVCVTLCVFSRSHARSE